MRNKIFIFFIVFMFANTHGFAGWLKIPFGKVVSLTGHPLINKTNATLNQKIYIGDRIYTNLNSTIKIKNKRGDVFFIGPNSIITIKHKKYIKIKNGTIRSIIEKLKPNESFRIVSEGGVAGVKGTEFIVYTNKKASVVFTKNGTVYLENLNKSVDTKEGQMSQSAHKVPPIEPVDFTKDRTLYNMFNLLQQITGMIVPEEMKKFKQLPEIIARWNINYTGYLIDKKEFKEALKYLDIAFLFTSIPDVKSEILIQKSIINTKFLKDYSSADKSLKTIIRDYHNTKFFEDAIFQMGFIGFEMGDYKRAKKYFNMYQKKFPHGKFKSQIKIILKQINEKQ